jgi:predicted nucleotidyltransferase
LHIQISWKEMKQLCSRVILKPRYIKKSDHEETKHILKYIGWINIEIDVVCIT